MDCILSLTRRGPPYERPVVIRMKPIEALLMAQVGPGEVVLYFLPSLFRQGNLDAFGNIVKRIKVGRAETVEVADQ
jgi:hypothetical protein